MRGFLYIDEVNLLEDHLVDLLIDVASSGENVVERDGLSVRHPARFVLVGSGNPEEGELRPQLLDRFGLSVEVKTPDDLPSRVEVGDSRLLGGLDLAATLRMGRPVAQLGLLAQSDGGLVVLASAERLPVATCARLAQVLDTGHVAMERNGLSHRSPARLGLVALDEGADDDEKLPPALLDRMAFHIPALPERALGYEPPAQPLRVWPPEGVQKTWAARRFLMRTSACAVRTAAVEVKRSTGPRPTRCAPRACCCPRCLLPTAKMVVVSSRCLKRPT